MQIVENEKQQEYLVDIRNVGLKIVMRECEKNEIKNTFFKYGGYMEDGDLEEYIKEVLKLNSKNNQGILINPDDLLLNLLRFIRNIQYEDYDEEDKYDYY